MYQRKNVRTDRVPASEACYLYDHHPECGNDLQRLYQPAVLPSRNRQLHCTAYPVQLHGKVLKLLQPAVRGRIDHHRSDADPVPDLQPEDRRRYGGRRS